MRTKMHISMIICLVLIIIGFLIAVFSPKDILDKYTFLEVITQKFKSIFPPIAGYAKKSNFPQISGLYFTYMWFISPVCFWASVQLVRDNEGLKTLKTMSLGKKINNFLIGVILLSTLAYFLYFVNPGYDFNLLPINSSQLALGASGYLFSGSAAAFLLALSYCFFVKLIPINNFRK